MAPPAAGLTCRRPAQSPRRPAGACPAARCRALETRGGRSARSSLKPLYRTSHLATIYSYTALAGTLIPTEISLGTY